MSLKACPSCAGRVVKVLRSRDVRSGRRRLHRCGSCAHTWSSIEVAEGVMSEQEVRAKSALEALIVALQTAVGEIKALSDARA
jgi:transcriptional regulator NrdR family protein